MAGTWLNFTRVASVTMYLATLSTLSCTLIVNDTSTKQCSSDSDCTNLGPSFANTVCQSNLCVPTKPYECRDVPQGASSTVKLTFQVSFAAKPVSDLGIFTVLACDRMDVNCASPIAGPVTESPADPNAKVTLTLPYGFQGYLQVTNPVAVNSMLFLARPVQADTVGWDLSIATEDTIAGLGFATGTVIDRSLGIFIIKTLDCNLTPLAGVQVSLDGTTTQATSDAGSGGLLGFYLSNKFPSRSLTSTTTEGAAGYINVPVGTATVAGVITEGDVHLEPTAVISRAGWISYIEVQP